MKMEKTIKVSDEVYSALQDMNLSWRRATYDEKIRHLINERNARLGIPLLDKYTPSD